MSLIRHLWKHTPLIIALFLYVVYSSHWTPSTCQIVYTGAWFRWLFYSSRVTLSPLCSDYLSTPYWIISTFPVVSAFRLEKSTRFPDTVSCKHGMRARKRSKREVEKGKASGTLVVAGISRSPLTITTAHPSIHNDDWVRNQFERPRIQATQHRVIFTKPHSVFTPFQACGSAP